MRDANLFYNAFLAAAKRSGRAPDTPLVHFLKYLLLCLEVRGGWPTRAAQRRVGRVVVLTRSERMSRASLQRDASQLFKALVNAYRPSIERDQELSLVSVMHAHASQHARTPRGSVTVHWRVRDRIMTPHRVAMWISLSQLLSQIGKVFYNIQPPKTGLSAMLGMMEAMMGGGKARAKTGK